MGDSEYALMPSPPGYMHTPGFQRVGLPLPESGDSDVTT